MASLTKAYIQQHRTTSHTYAAFGKLIIDAILDEAEAAVGTNSVNQLNVQIDFQVTPYTDKDCLRICISKANGETWCTNQFTDDVYKLD
ncbi:MAG: hypothetical protein IT257_12495 [Chitinophagaceae bacterium]|nr:hypothetical protein [Chitinophagaceae bacterium]